MRSAANRLAHPVIHLLLSVLVPAGALAAQARSSMEVSVQVVYSSAAATLIETAATLPATSAIDSGAECETIGNIAIAAGVSATCSWDPNSHTYLVTVQY